MEVLRGMQLQVITVSPTDEPAYTCFETGGPAPVPCTTVISTQPDNSASTQLFMGGEAPADAPCLPVSAASASLTVAVYQSDARIAHAIIPLDQVWEVCLQPSFLPHCPVPHASSTSGDPCISIFISIHQIPQLGTDTLLLCINCLHGRMQDVQTCCDS